MLVERDVLGAAPTGIEHMDQLVRALKKELEDLDQRRRYVLVKENPHATLGE
jgi:hypothetical protein